MSKKQKRRSTSAAVKPAATTGSYATTTLPTTNPQPNTALRRSTQSITEFKPDYSSVIRDLKRIGILAGSFIGILVILSFFLR